MDSAGYVFQDWYGTEKMPGPLDGYVEYIEGRDAEGAVLWTYGTNLLTY